MIKKQIEIPPVDIYPFDDWRMIQKKYSEKYMAQNETIFALSNGYLGIRGNFEEGKPVFQRGTFVNGFYESWPIVYGEKAYGFAKTGQTMLHVTDSHIICLSVDDEDFFVSHPGVLEFERVLDMRAGILHRHILWETSLGKRVLIQSRRLVSLVHRHVAAMCYTVTVLGDAAHVVLSSQMYCEEKSREDDPDPRSTKQFRYQVFCPQSHYHQDMRGILVHQTQESRLCIASGMDHRIHSLVPFSSESFCSHERGELTIRVEAKPEEPLQLEKFMAYVTPRDDGIAMQRDMCARELDGAYELGWDGLAQKQGEFLQKFWENGDIRIQGAHPRSQQCVHFNLFHLVQASAQVEGTGVGPRGLTGSAYEGHYFWDAEIYVLPFLIYQQPHVARKLLHFRYTLLDKARHRARELNQRGALFPWRTINGDEASAFFPAGTAQYHINADIAYALNKYVSATGDQDFLDQYGVEILIETARLWCDLGFYTGHTPDNASQFHIHGVTGPDEYTAIVNDNLYTNIMARENLRYAVKAVEDLQQRKPDAYQALADRLELKDHEKHDWQRAADAMCIAYDETLGIHPQDDVFLKRERWDFDNTPVENYPLLLHYHPLVIYRHQVIKQPDVVLAMFLLGDQFSREQKKKNFDYYEPITTGDSSLSACIQGVLAIELGYANLAFEYIRQAAMMDLANVGGNVKDGAHIASMGGTWISLVYGVAGFRDDHGRFSFRPCLAQALQSLQFCLTIAKCVLELSFVDTKVHYRLKQGQELQFYHEDKHILLDEKTQSATFDIDVIRDA